MGKTTVVMEKHWPKQRIEKEQETLGTIGIRIVVLGQKISAKGKTSSVVDEEEEGIVVSGPGPLDSYLERPSGKGYMVFLVHGQRQHTVDEWFVGRRLDFKYLRKRTMVIVDVDGLRPEVISQLVQGSRQGFYKGSIFYSLLERIEGVLKADPDLRRLEADAEEEIAELKTGDEAVRNALDKLIEGHHTAALRFDNGTEQQASETSPEGHLGGKHKAQDVVVQAKPEIGDPATEPVLVMDPPRKLIRLIPDQERTLTIHLEPASEWSKLERYEVCITPETPELGVEVSKTTTGLDTTLLFSESMDMEDEDYPIITTLKVVANLQGYEEPRLLKRELVINRSKRRPPPPDPDLFDDPTYLRVVSRQPVKLVPGGPATHVRLRWDGKDELATGWQPAWTFRGGCLSLTSFPPPIFSVPRKGNFELLLDTPHGLIAGQKLEFEVEVEGVEPEGKVLRATFEGEVMQPAPEPEPRKVEGEVPDGDMQRRPPYDLRIVKEDQWDTGTCWNASTWTKDDAGCFNEPTESTPVVLIINQDAELLRSLTEDMIKRKLEERTVRERQNRYTAHIAFHLYQMYQHLQDRKTDHETNEAVRVPEENELRLEINRVAATLLKVMER